MAGAMVHAAGSSPPQEVLEAAAAIVDDVIAQAEATANRKGSDARKDEEDPGGFAGMLKKGTRWQNRARGFFSRFLTHFKICKDL